MKFTFTLLSCIAAFASIASAVDCPAAQPGCSIVYESELPPHTKCNKPAFGVKKEGKILLQECQVYGQDAQDHCASLCAGYGKKCKAIRMRQNITGPGSFCQVYGTAINKMGLVQHPGSSANPDYYYTSSKCFYQTCAS